MVVLALLVAVLLVQLVPCGSRELPNEYSDFLKEMDAVETYDQPSQELSEDKRQSDVPHHQDGVTIIKTNKTLSLPNALCKPRLTPVDTRENQPFSAIYVPVFVELHRCAGSGNPSLQLLKRCVVTEAEEVSVPIMDVTTPKQIEVKMLDHTKCGEDCIIQASSCDNTKEDYDKSTCRCQCRDRADSCNATYQQWNSHDCQCTCKFPPRTCLNNSVKEEWNKETCQCDCLQSIKKRCVRKGKELDRASCSCVCPAIVCPSGTTLSKATCVCV